MSKALDQLLAIPSNSLLCHEDANGVAGDAKPTTTTLGDLQDSKATVYDFWTTRCTNCPAALDALDALARERPSVKFVGVNIDDARLARELVAKAASEGRWTSLSHAHLGEDEKEKAKDILGMRTVPFYVVVGEDGTVLRHGNAKALPIKTVDSLDAALLPAPTTAVNEDGDGQQNENNAAVANTEKAANPTTAAAVAAAAATSKAAPLMECEGGVCKLVRKPKQAAPEQAPEETVPPSSSTSTPATATAVAAAAAGPAPVPAASAANPSRTMECEGDVCKLVRKPKKADPEETPKETVTASASAAPAATPATAPTTRTMECEGGVCKLVRKPKKAAAPEQPPTEERAAATTTMENKAKEEAEEETPLTVGDTMPSLQVIPLDGGIATTLDEVRAGGPAVLDFWTTRCVRCPAALDSLEGLAAASAGVTYISLNLDSLEGARGIVADGRWPSLSHVFAGGHDDDSEAALERFKARAGLKSVPFYVVLAGDGRIEQIGGPKAVKLEKKAAARVDDGATAVALPKATSSVPAEAAPAATVAVAAEAPKASYSFTMDEDF